MITPPPWCLFGHKAVANEPAVTNNDPEIVSLANLAEWALRLRNKGWWRLHNQGRQCGQHEHMVQSHAPWHRGVEPQLTA